MVTVTLLAEQELGERSSHPPPPLPSLLLPLLWLLPSLSLLPSPFPCVGTCPRRRWRPPPSALAPAHIGVGTRPVGVGARPRWRWRPTAPASAPGRVPPGPPPSALAPSFVCVVALPRRRWCLLTPAPVGVGALPRQRWGPPPLELAPGRLGVGTRPRPL